MVKFGILRRRWQKCRRKLTETIGRYQIAFGRTFWVQTRVPTTVRHFLFFWVFKEARPTDIDSKQRFPLGTLMGRYRYYKAEGPVRKEEIVPLLLHDETELEELRRSEAERKD